MKMENIMDYRVVVYIIVTFAVTFAMSGLNINSIFKKGHVIEARVTVALLIMAVAELVSSFIINFLEVSKIINA